MPDPFLGLCQWRPKSHPRTSAQAAVVRCRLHPLSVAPAVLIVVGRGQQRHALMSALLLEVHRLVPPQKKSQSNPQSLELVPGDRGSPSPVRGTQKMLPVLGRVQQCLALLPALLLEAHQSLEFPLPILGHAAEHVLAVACMPFPDAVLSSAGIPDLAQALRPL
ncbi:unnamed protein product [Staurois parvus]|uniref:Uncharacterized protein n=1 Tax=Staurois parvus TaxID=386267 RepID=A0ABN9CS22_9NEOB|nr:unnamed protein product [Staurois parvus]